MTNELLHQTNAVAYQAPAIEVTIDSAEVRREVHYAGDIITILK
jgi:hypothetical protein